MVPDSDLKLAAWRTLQGLGKEIGAAALEMDPLSVVGSVVGITPGQTHTRLSTSVVTIAFKASFANTSVFSIRFLHTGGILVALPVAQFAWLSLADVGKRSLAVTPHPAEVARTVGHTVTSAAVFCPEFEAVARIVSEAPFLWLEEITQTKPNIAVNFRVGNFLEYLVIFLSVKDCGQASAVVATVFVGASPRLLLREDTEASLLICGLLPARRARHFFKVAETTGLLAKGPHSLGEIGAGALFLPAAAAI